MDPSSDVETRFGGLSVGRRTDPRGPQLVFLVPVVALLAVVLLHEPAALVRPVVLAGLAVVVVATLASLLLPWPRLPLAGLAAVPLLDLVAVGLFGLSPALGAASLLLVLPAIWLASVFRSTGVLLATVASVVVLSGPTLLYVGTGLEGWTRAVLLPIIAFVAGSSLAVTVDRWDRHRRQLEAIVQAVDVGLLLLDRDGRYHSMNPRHAEFMALAFPGGHAGDSGQVGFAYAADRVSRLESEQTPSKRAAGGEAFSDEVIWVGESPDTRRALAVSARPLFDDDDDFDGAVLAYQDVTDLMRALQVKDEFVASVSHELRTPLTSIIGYLDLVLEDSDDLPEHVARHLRVTERNAQRLLLLVSDLLTTAQAEGGTLRLSPEDADVGSIVRMSVTGAQTTAKSGDVRITARIADVPVVQADVGRIGQVVDNLISNAVKYTLAGGQVVVGLDRDGEEVVLTVSDTGIGISETDQERLFTKFFRSPATEAMAVPGVGLGLVISRAIVEGHGGHIEVTSSEGVGTTVTVRLPIGSAPAAESADRVLAEHTG